jgi:aryl-alcohol dehydrogenase-like predicted oxidoreductase
MLVNQFVYGAAKASDLSKNVAKEVMSKLYEHGLREIDTAPSYGNSEILIGAMQQDFPNLRINTKVGLDSNGAFTPDHIKQSAYRSLENLRIDSINTLFIHSVPYKGISSAALNAVQELKQEGICKEIGYSGDGEDLLWSLKKVEKDFDAIMFTYNFLDQVNLRNLITDNNEPKIYVKRVLANGVWQRRTSKDYIKDLLGRSRGHDEYRDRMKKLYPRGVTDGYVASIDFVRESLPDAKYLIGISKPEQCNRLIDYLKFSRDLAPIDQNNFKQIFIDYSRDTYLGPVT